MLSALRWINPLFWMRNLSQFFGHWFRSFPLTKIGAALPAVLALMAILLTILLTYASDSRWRRGLVLQQFRKAKMNRSNEEVSLLARRLLVDTPDDNSLRFEAAAATAEIAFELQREADPANEDALSPEEEPALGSAAASPSIVEIAKTADEPVSSTSDPTINDFDFDTLFGDGVTGTYVGTADDSGAPSKPKDELEKERKLAQGEAAIADLTRLALDNKVGEAAVWLRDQTSITNDTERFARQLTLLNRATQIAPNHPLVLTDLMSVALQCADEQNPKVAELREVLVQGVVPEMAHFIRGTSAMMNDDIETATLHLELAAETLETVPAVLNNLAVALASRDDGQLERALALVNQAIEKTPNQPYFYETRAQILLKLNRHQEAIVNFERAMPATALRPQFHRGLSVAYGTLGQKELADRHHDLALAADKANAAAPTEGDNKELNINFGSRGEAAPDTSEANPSDAETPATLTD